MHKEWKRIFLGLVAFVLALLPIHVKAADYEAGFKFYKFDTSYLEGEYIKAKHRTYQRFLDEGAVKWLKAYQSGLVEELTSESKLNPGDTIAVANTLKTIGTAKATSFALYYVIDSEIFEPIAYRDPDNGSMVYVPGQIDNRIEYDGGPLPVDSWKKQVISPSTNNPSEISATFADSELSYPVEYSSITQTPITFVFLKVKDSAPAGKTAKFTYITSENVSDISSSPLYTKASTSTSISVDVATVDSSVISVKEAEKDTTATIDSITATSGSNSYTFIKNASGEYEGIVPPTVSSLAFVITPTSNKAVVSTTDLTGTSLDSTTGAFSGNYSVASVGENSFTIMVTPESGVSGLATYTIKAKKLSDVATLDSLTLSDVTGFTFNKATTSYSNITAPYKASSITITAKASSGAVIKSGLSTITNNGSDGTESMSLNIGVNYKTITVEAENCDSKYASVPGNSCSPSKSYSLIITRNNPRTETELSMIKVNNTDIAGFSGTTETYNLSDVGNSVDSLNIDAVKLYNEQTVEVSSNASNLQVGNNTITIKVTAEDTTKTRTYTLNVKRKSTDTSLALDVKSTPQGTLTFDSNSNTYTYTYDRTVSTVNITGTNDNGAIITGIPAGAYTITNDPITISVTPEDGVVKTYTLKFVQKKDTDSSLKALQVININNNNPYTLSPTFSSGETDYSVTVDKDITKVKIEATKNSDYATVTGDGEITLQSGEHTYSVVVTAEDSNYTTTYNIKINKPVNNNATLTDLKVDGTTVSGFNASTTTYSYEVGYDKTSVKIEATGVAGSTVTINGADSSGNVSLPTVGVNTITVNVDSEDNSAHEAYVINVKRKSNDATATLSVTSTPNSTLKLGSTQFLYNLDVPAEVTTLSINATPATGAKIKNASSLSNIDVSGKTLNEIRVEVEAEDSNYTNTYIIKVNYLASTNTELGSLVVKNGSEVIPTAYDATTRTYKATVGPTVSTIQIEATKKLNSQTISGDVGTHTLVDGKNTYTITVQAEDTTKTQDYKVEITRTQNIDSLISSITVLGNNAIWNPTDSRYEVSVDANALEVNPSDVVITVTSGSVTRKDNKITLNAGNNNYIFEVTATDNTKKDYTIVINRPSSTDTSLKTLTSDVGSISKKNDTTYTLTIPKGTNSFTITAEPTSGRATVVGAGLKNVSGLVDNKFSITVTPEAGSSKVYEVEVQFEESTNNYLSNLVVEGQTLTPVFNKETLNYTVNVPKDVTSVTVKATKEKNDAKVKMGIDTLSETDTFVASNLQDGETIVKVDVTGSDNATRNYTVKIVKSDTIPTEITSTVHTIDDKYIRTVKINETALNLKNELTNDNQYLVIRDASDTRNISDSEKLATGMMVKLMVNGVEKDRKYIVIRGDTTGDGELDPFDSVLIISHYLGTPLTGAYLEAAYVTDDSEIDPFDGVKVISHYLGFESLF